MVIVDKELESRKNELLHPFPEALIIDGKFENYELSVVEFSNFDGFFKIGKIANPPVIYVQNHTTIELIDENRGYTAKIVKEKLLEKFNPEEVLWINISFIFQNILHEITLRSERIQEVENFILTVTEEVDSDSKSYQNENQEKIQDFISKTVKELVRDPVYLKLPTNGSRIIYIKERYGKDMDSEDIYYTDNWILTQIISEIRVIQTKEKYGR